jgi:hypothetical protein
LGARRAGAPVHRPRAARPLQVLCETSNKRDSGASAKPRATGIAAVACAEPSRGTSAV